MDLGAGDVVFNPASFPLEPPEGTVVQAYRMVTRVANRETDVAGVREVSEPCVGLYIRYTSPVQGAPLWHTLHGLIGGGGGKPGSPNAMPWWMLCRESEKARRPIIIVDTLSEAAAHCPHCMHPVGPLEMRIMMDEIRHAAYGLDRPIEAPTRP